MQFDWNKKLPNNPLVLCWNRYPIHPTSKTTCANFQNINCRWVGTWTSWDCSVIIISIKFIFICLTFGNIKYSQSVSTHLRVQNSIWKISHSISYKIFLSVNIYFKMQEDYIIICHHCNVSNNYDCIDWGLCSQIFMYGKFRVHSENAICFPMLCFLYII